MKHNTNTILESYLTAEFQQGITSFGQLETLTAEDLLWVGQCYFGLDQNIQALNCFYRDHALGLEEGLVFASTVLRFSENTGRSSQVLAQVEQTKLSHFGLAAWHREHGLQLVAARKMTQAVHELEIAWQGAASDQIGQRLLPRYSQSLALALLELGHDASALQYLNMAISLEPPNPELLLLRAAARAYLGDLSLALEDLERFDCLAPSAKFGRAGDRKSVV